jgi:hypothetical protein
MLFIFVKKYDFFMSKPSWRDYKKCRRTIGLLGNCIENNEENIILYVLFGLLPYTYPPLAKI